MSFDPISFDLSVRFFPKAKRSLWFVLRKNIASLGSKLGRHPLSENRYGTKLDSFKQKKITVQHGPTTEEFPRTQITMLLQIQRLYLTKRKADFKKVWFVKAKLKALAGHIFPAGLMLCITSVQGPLRAWEGNIRPVGHIRFFVYYIGDFVTDSRTFQLTGNRFIRDRERFSFFYINSWKTLSKYCFDWTRFYFYH